MMTTTMLLLVPLLLLVSAPPLCQSVDEATQEVQTLSGRVRGVRQLADNGKKVDMFWGIPYAEPPVGKLRFRAPEPIKTWSGVREANRRPNSCVQILDMMFPNFAGSAMWNPNTHMSEDCLYLNIAVPTPQPNNSAVMIWIYGGSFYAGTSTLDVYDPKILASDQNIIVASLQYRVASLGFLYLGGEGGVEGNAGLLDQRLAIKWIHENIASFGGNPHNITLFSESAGSASVAFHLLSPGSAPYFSQAILQSAAATNPWAMITQKEAMLRTRRLAELLKCPHEKDELSLTVECLRTRKATEMVDAEWNGIVFGIMGCPFVPVLADNFFPESPAKALARKNFKKTKIMVGTNENEGYYFLIYFLTDIFKKQENITVSRSDFKRAVRELNSYVSPLGLEAIIYEYTNWGAPNDSTAMIKALDKMVGDYQFTCPTLEMAQSYADTMLREVVVYEYFFNYRSTVNPWPSWTGVLHGDEIAFIFGEPFKTKLFNYTDEERQLSRDMMTTWANFAKTGNPNRFSNGSWLHSFYWPVYSRTFKEYLTLNPKNKTKGLGLDSRKCAFWSSYLPSLLATNDPTAECTSDQCHEQCSSTPSSLPRPPPPPPSSSSSAASAFLSFLLLLLLLVLVLAGS